MSGRKGRGGPPPEPRRLKIVKGTEKRPTRPGWKRHEAPPVEVPDPPSWLAPEAAVEWSRLAPVLAADGALDPRDHSAFAAYCEAVAALQAAARDLRERGSIIEGRHGTPVRNPAMATLNQAAQLVRGYALEFGLTPAARLRLEKPAEDAEDERESLAAMRQAAFDRKGKAGGPPPDAS